MWKHPETNLRNPKFPLIKASRLHPSSQCKKAASKLAFATAKNIFLKKSSKSFAEKEKSRTFATQKPRWRNR